jgi:hypothetical protein
MAPNKGMIAGSYFMQIAFRNSDGLPMGSESAPDAVASGVTSHAYKVKGYISVEAPAITRSFATRKAGQKILGTKQLGLASIAPFNIVLSDLDELFFAYISGGVVDSTTASGNTIIASNVNKVVKPQFVAIFTMGFQNDEGTDEYLNYFYPNVTFGDAIPGGNDGDGDNPNAQTYSCAPTQSPNTGFGFTFAETALAVVDNSDLFVCVRAPKPLGLTTYVDDGAATSFVTGYLPTSSVVDGSTNMIAIDGVDGNAQIAALSVTTGATTHTAQTEDDIWNLAYYTDFEPIPA